MESSVQKSVPGWWETLGGERVGLGLCLAHCPQFLSSVLWVEMSWEPQQMPFRVGGTADGKRVYSICIAEVSLQLVQAMILSLPFQPCFQVCVSHYDISDTSQEEAERGESCLY